MEDLFFYMFISGLGVGFGFFAVGLMFYLVYNKISNKQQKKQQKAVV